MAVYVCWYEAVLKNEVSIDFIIFLPSPIPLIVVRCNFLSFFHKNTLMNGLSELTAALAARPALPGGSW